MKITFGKKSVDATSIIDESKKTHDLDTIALEGNGIYTSKVPLFGETASDVMLIPAETFSTGLLYFEASDFTRDNFRSALELIGVRNVTHLRDQTNHYRVFMNESESAQQGYLTQAKFVTDFGAQFYYQDKTPSPSQPFGVIDACCGFVEAEIERYGGLDNGALYERMGVDNVFGSLGLAFGFMRENSYHEISRIWSRVAFYSK